MRPNSRKAYRQPGCSDALATPNIVDSIGGLVVVLKARTHKSSAARTAQNILNADGALRRAACCAGATTWCLARSRSQPLPVHTALVMLTAVSWTTRPARVVVASASAAKAVQIAIVRICVQSNIEM